MFKHRLCACMCWCHHCHVGFSILRFAALYSQQAVHTRRSCLLLVVQQVGAAFLQRVCMYKGKMWVVVLPPILSHTPRHAHVLPCHNQGLLSRRRRAAAYLSAAPPCSGRRCPTDRRWRTPSPPASATVEAQQWCHRNAATHGRLLPKSTCSSSSSRSRRGCSRNSRAWSSSSSSSRGNNGSRSSRGSSGSRLHPVGCRPAKHQSMRLLGCKACRFAAAEKNSRCQRLAERMSWCKGQQEGKFQHHQQQRPCRWSRAS